LLEHYILQDRHLYCGSAEGCYEYSALSKPSAVLLSFEIHYFVLLNLSVATVIEYEVCTAQQCADVE